MLAVQKSRQLPRVSPMTSTEHEIGRAIRNVFRFLNDSRGTGHVSSVSDILSQFNWYGQADAESVKLWHPVVSKLETALSKSVQKAGAREIKNLGYEGRVRFTIEKKKKNESLVIPVNTSSRDWIAFRSSALVASISDEQREMLRVLLHEAFLLGKRPDIMADEIGKLVGLHERYARAVLSRIALMIDGGMSESGAEKHGRKYANDLRRARGKAIARTENKDAMSQGQLDSWRMLRNEGLIEPGAKKEWLSVEGSPRTSNICNGLDGQIVGIDENFYSVVLGREVERPPAHTNCRSHIKLILPEE